MIHLSLNVICILAKASLFGILVNPQIRVSYLADCNLYVVKIRSHKKTSSIVGFKLCKLNYYLAMEVSTALLCCTVLTQVEIMDSLNLCRIPFQGLPLLGNLHSVDITRRIGSLICSRLTLNVIHSGQLEAWTFFVRETSLTKSFNQTTQKNDTRRFCMESTACSRTLWSAQEIQTCSLFKVGNVSERSETKTPKKPREILSVDLRFNFPSLRVMWRSETMRSNWARVESFLHPMKTSIRRCLLKKYYTLMIRMKRTRKTFSWPSPQPWKHFSFSTCFHSAWNHACSFLWLFQGYTILLILKHVFFFSFSFFQPSLSGSEWLMTLRWIVERSSGGSARPRGGPGPPIAGFVMVCPWCLRCPSYPEIPSFSSLIALCGIRIFKMKLHEPTQHE